MVHTVLICFSETGQRIWRRSPSEFPQVDGVQRSPHGCQPPPGVRLAFALSVVGREERCQGG